jgi:hypothetical protein
MQKIQIGTMTIEVCDETKTTIIAQDLKSQIEDWKSTL